MDGRRSESAGSKNGTFCYVYKISSFWYHTLRLWFEAHSVSSFRFCCSSRYACIQPTQHDVVCRRFLKLKLQPSRTQSTRLIVLMASSSQRESEMGRMKRERWRNSECVFEFYSSRQSETPMKSPTGTSTSCCMHSITSSRVRKAIRRRTRREREGFYDQKNTRNV